MCRCNSEANPRYDTFCSYNIWVYSLCQRTSNSGASPHHGKKDRNASIESNNGTNSREKEVKASRREALKITGKDKERRTRRSRRKRRGRRVGRRRTKRADHIRGKTEEH